MRRAGWIVAFTLALAATAEAEPAAEAAPDQADAPAPADDAEPAPALPPHKVGPQLVSLGDGIEIDLPAGMILLEKTEAQAMLEARGDHPDGTVGVVFMPDGPWEVVIGFDGIGYVSDADADKLDADELLKVLDRGNREQNKVRVAKGVTELFIDGWTQPPRYDQATHLLTWGLDLHTSEGKLLNELTNVLGRRGIVSLTLITDPDQLAVAREQSAGVFAGVRFQAGHRYQDFDPSVDKDSGIGLRGLIVGAGGLALLKGGKVGLLAKILIVFKKFFWLIGLAIAGFFKKLFGRKDPAPPAAPSGTT